METLKKTPLYSSDTLPSEYYSTQIARKCLYNILPQWDYITTLLTSPPPTSLEWVYQRAFVDRFCHTLVFFGQTYLRRQSFCYIIHLDKEKLFSPLLREHNSYILGSLTYIFMIGHWILLHTSILKGETKKTSVLKNYVYTKSITVNIYIE